ncbi:hypothetical protein LVB87_15615 [Lysobacter sp. KIS68-7]|uniref:hypothetical protein n=1 Tax=Lysobacter sp. KIS68-7 TaxID=2904252 RepID=UPI001E3C995A|nr:hypothetical protein [Lysobacter sp. KIS68-7]UHQ19594.1 hypothetical protein LVB87_15615 [Lysobacter sp. KIS68-7]
MEAENYLSGGYGLRLQFQNHSQGSRIGHIASVWQPHRLKGIQLDKEFGTPFLAATQVFDLRPSPRKFLSLDRTEDSSERFIENGTIVVTCSGSVGRATLIYAAHKGVLISHDLLRISPKKQKHWGWLYAFLRTKSAHEMMMSEKYGHMIKHLEPGHIEGVPVPILRDDLLRVFNDDVRRVLEHRNQAWSLQKEAEDAFAAAVGGVPSKGSETGFTVRASELLKTRRRLEASFHSPMATDLIEQFKRRGLQIELLADVSDGVWWLTRFKRIFGDEGDRYLSADELFSINPGVTKRVLVEQADNPDSYRVKAGWIVMACSGQTYGLNGSVSLMTKKHEDAFFSHDLIRIIPKEGHIRPGYLFTVLGHPELGRPLVIRNAYGTSIPHLDPDDVARTPVVRLKREIEQEIAAKMERAIELRVSADALEDDLANRAELLIHEFLSGDVTSFCHS